MSVDTSAPTRRPTASAPPRVTRADCEERLDLLNARIRSHGGLVEVSSFDEETGRLRIRLTGLCGSCPAWPTTLYGLVRPYLRDELGLEDVEFENRRVSASASARLDAAFGVPR